jgi:hypothetical protein
MTPHQMRMRLRLKRMKLFKNCSLREYESFVWKVYTKRSREIEDVPFFLKRQAE